MLQNEGSSNARLLLKRSTVTYTETQAAVVHLYLVHHHLSGGPFWHGSSFGNTIVIIVILVVRAKREQLIKMRMNSSPCRKTSSGEVLPCFFSDGSISQQNPGCKYEECMPTAARVEGLLKSVSLENFFLEVETESE